MGFHIKITSSILRTGVLLVITSALAEPVFGATQSVVFGAGDGVSATVDTFLHQNARMTNHGTSTELSVDRDDPGGTGSHVQTLIRTTGLFGDGSGKVV